METDKQSIYMHIQRNFFIATLFATLFTSGGGIAHALDYSGYMYALYDRAIGELPSGYTIDSKVDMKGRFKLKTRAVNHFRGVLAIDPSAYNREVVPTRLYVDYKPNRMWRLRIGYAKKIVGLAYEQDKEDRLTIHRDPVYDKMNRSGLVGRQLAISLRLSPGKSRRNTLALAASHDGSRNSNITYSAIHRFASVRGLRAGLWGIVERRNFKAVGRLTVFAHALALWYQREASRFAVEVIHGIDPDATQFEMLFHNSRKVHFLGPRVEASYRYRLTDAVSLQPLVSSSLTFDDLHRPRGNALRFLGGLNLQIHQLVVSINAETVGTSSPENIGERRYEQKNIYGEIAFYF